MPSLQHCKFLTPRLCHHPPCRAILHTTRCLATAAPNPLTTWVTANGGTVAPALDIVAWGGDDGGAGYGLGATAPITSGQHLVSLPTPLQLTYDEQTTPASLLGLIKQVPEELWGAKLALQLLAQRAQGEQSLWAPYIRNLPVGFPGVPMFFAGEELVALQYPPVVEQVKKRCRWLLQFSQGALSQQGEEGPMHGAQVDANALGWALAAVTSRAFRVKGPSHPAACLPLIDMANHAGTPNAAVRPVGSTGVAMVALRDIEAGEPILLDYGKLSNDFFLMDYGFVVESNPHDDIKLSFDVSLLDGARALASLPGELQPAPWQQAVLAKLGLAGPGASVEVSLGRGARLVDPRLLAATRVLCATNAAETRARTPESMGHWDHPLHPANEVKALTTLVGVAALSLAAFPTRLEEDVQLLQRGGVSDNMRLALLFRVEKKRLLVEAMQTMGERIKALANTPHTGPKGRPKKGAPPARATSKGFGAK